MVGLADTYPILCVHPAKTPMKYTRYQPPKPSRLAPKTDNGMGDKFLIVRIPSPITGDAEKVRANQREHFLSIDDVRLVDRIACAHDDFCDPLEFLLCIIRIEVHVRKRLPDRLTSLNFLKGQR